MATKNAGAGVGIDAGPIPGNVGAREMGPPANGSMGTPVTPYQRDNQMPGNGSMKTRATTSTNAFGSPGSGAGRAPK